MRQNFTPSFIWANARRSVPLTSNFGSGDKNAFQLKFMGNSIFRNHFKLARVHNCHLIGIGGGFAAPPLPHHRTYGSVYGGSVILALTGWRFGTLSADVGFTAYAVPFGLHPIRTGQAQPKLIGWC